jgi:hypothetical protein
VDGELEAVEEDECGDESDSRRQQVRDAEVLLSVKVEARSNDPDREDGNLQQDNVSVVAVMPRDLARASDSPGE